MESELASMMKVEKLEEAVLSIYCCIAYDFFSIPHDLSLLSLQFIAAFAWIYCCIPN
jgi:hypothetical protein